MDYDPTSRLLTLRLLQLVNPSDVRALMKANADALAATGGDAFRVLVDLRRLFPLDQDAVDLFAEVKRACLDHVGFHGLAVLADSPTVAMQQHHTRVRQGTDPSKELITRDESEARAFLERPLP